MLTFDIKRYAINDGPGIRVTLFMKGCPLSCVWCHNPEGISPYRQRMYTRKKCIGCGACITACQKHALSMNMNGIVVDSSRCDTCGHCADVCPSLATEMSGQELSVDDLMHEIEKEIFFMDRSEGGVTFCGGEPLLYPDILIALLRRCGALGIHRAVDTTLFANSERVEKVMTETDLFLIDLKHMDSDKHRLYCGVPNERILLNIRLLAEFGKPFVIRIPLIEGVNADEENQIETTRFLSSLPWKEKIVHLLPYHDIGKGKHEKLGTIYNPDNYPMTPPSETICQQWIDSLTACGITVSS